MGSGIDHALIKAQLVELGAIAKLVAIVYDCNLEIKRAAAYFFARLAEWRNAGGFEGLEFES